LCGKDHGFMPIVVEVKTRAEYDAWVAEQKQALAHQPTQLAMAEAR
jgi:cytochrome c oxidase subunit 2